MNEVRVRVTSKFGEPRIYPECNLLKTVAKIAKRNTLTMSQIEGLAKELGAQIVVTNAPTLTMLEAVRELVR